MGSLLVFNTNDGSLESVDLPDSAQTEVAVWVGAPGVRFHNVYTMFNYVDVTVGGLSINREQGTPQVWLLFPVSTATSTEIAADAVKVSEDGTQVQARFALLEKVLEDVAPTLRISHPSIGTQEWQAPTLHVFGVDADVHLSRLIASTTLTVRRAASPQSGYRNSQQAPPNRR
jgi:hypothetical protein